MEDEQPDRAPDAGRHEQIERAARAFWEAEGRPEGREWEHWFRAEAEVDSRKEETTIPDQVEE